MANRRKGRRSGSHDTCEQIVIAARACFAELGYDRTSLREVARRAGVDAALVHHYFADGKLALFVAAFRLRHDPLPMVEELLRDDSGGAAIVHGFLALWEPGIHDRPASPVQPSFAVLAQAMASSQALADAMREFLAERVWSHVGHEQARDEWQARRALITSQLMGAAWARYVLRIEPLASASPDEVAALVGPTIERYRTEPLPRATTTPP